MRSMLQAVAFALVLMTASELLYYPVAVSRVPELLLFYLVPVLAWMWWRRRFPSGRWESAVIAGAVYGFVVEGVIVPVLYEAPWFTISYPSLAWHLLVSVAVVQLGIRRALDDHRWWPMPALTMALAVLLGVWWPAWTVEITGPMMLGNLVVAVVLIAAGHLLQHWLPPASQPAPSRALTWIIWTLVLLLFAVGPLLAVPWAPIVLGPLLWLCWHASTSEPPTGPVLVTPRRAPWRLAWLAVVPGIATAVWAVARPLGQEAEALIGFPQFLAGWAVFVAALVRLRRRGRQRLSTYPSSPPSVTIERPEASHANEPPVTFATS